MTLLAIGAAVCAAVLLLSHGARARLGRILRPRSSRPRSSRPRSSRPRRHGTPGARRSYGDIEPALVLDLVAVGLAGGLDPLSALAATGRCLGADADPTDDLEAAIAALGPVAGAGATDVLRELRTALTFSEKTGAPAAEMLRSRADDLRRRRTRRAEEAAGRLGVQIVLPLGTCILPAFIALGVMPVVLSLVSQLGTIY